jgi:hypothetical protein
MKQIVLDVHSVPLWLMKEYLAELGGEIRDDHHVEGDGWQAYFYKIENFQLGSIVVGRLRLELSGEEVKLDGLISKLDIKLMRGGA